MALSRGSTKLGSERHQHNQFPLAAALRPPNPGVPLLQVNGRWIDATCGNGRRVREFRWRHRELEWIAGDQLMERHPESRLCQRTGAGKSPHPAWPNASRPADKAANAGRRSPEKYSMPVHGGHTMTSDISTTYCACALLQCRRRTICSGFGAPRPRSEFTASPFDPA
jgi:hypothetical protein